MGNTLNSTKNEELLPSKAMTELHEQILFEYPFLSNIYESMLVADNNKPDCPIVWANEQFEAMTLYSKEEILGRNCRFLQGKYTDREIVSEIRTAVEKGQSLDIELLNYRKDGVAFWNCFLMLPVHPKGTKTGRPNYFIAIQKDVTILKSVGPNPSSWTPPEVAMWMDHNGFGRFSRAAVQHAIDGEKLMLLSWTDLPLLGITLSSVQKNFMTAVSAINKDSPLPQRKSDQYQTPQDRKAVLPKEFWNKEKPMEKLVLKCFIDDQSEPTLLLLEGSPTFEKLVELVTASFGNRKIYYMEDDYKSQVTDESSLSAILTLNMGTTVSLHLEKEREEVSETVTKHLFAIPLALLLTSPLGEITYINRAGCVLLNIRDPQEYIGSSISKLIPTIMACSLQDHPVGGKKVDVVDSKSHVRKCLVGISDTVGSFTISLIPCTSLFSKNNALVSAIQSPASLKKK
eukprot:TRINITY_DN3464_c0_g1_i1.p1 TRINITY_DN3464_c0_g1~~TRINITY_DN3464_c0_g1_i1.p1  ORF type:complete len:458 (-),score=109.44 TRINITY_DN3464_c0_g1_i1:38-1411(-)